MKKIYQRALLALLLVGGVAATPFLGCSFLKKTIGWVVQRPQVELRHISVKKASLQGVHLEVALLVNNPNDFGLSLAKLKYKLLINDQQLAEGAIDQKLSIPAEFTVPLNLPLTINPSHSLTILKQVWQERATTVAKWHATAFFDSPVGEIAISFEDEKPLS